MAADDGYPPRDHVLRSLGLEIDLVSGTEHDARVRCIDGFGALATSVDVLAGLLCSRAVAPDWMATSSLQLHLWQPPDRADHLRARVLRAGSRSVCVEVDVARGAPAARELLGTAVVTFARLPRRATNLVLPADAPDAGGSVTFDPTGGSTVPFESLLSCEVLDASVGATSTALTAGVRNSFGALNGGVAAALVERSARLAAVATEAAEGSGPGAPSARSLTVDYLGQATHGPVHSVAVPLARDRRGDMLLRVELRDTGRTDDTGQVRLMALGHVTMTPR